MARAIAGAGPERNNRLFLILAIAAGLIAAVLVFVALSDGGGGDESSAVGRVNVVVASRDIAAGTRIDSGMLKTAAVTSELKLDGSYAEIAPLEGFVARYPIVAGEQITLSKIGTDVDAEEKDGLSYIVPPGQRAISVSVSQVSGVGGLLLPGDRVDVIAVFNDSDTEDGGARAVTMFQNVELLAIDQEAQELAPPPATADDEAAADETTAGISQRSEDAAPQPNATTATLALTPDQAQLIALAEQEAQIWLSLRPFGEEQQVELGPTSLLPLLTP